MTAKMPRSLRYWEIRREVGRTKFILMDGILKWGLSMFIIVIICFEPQHHHMPLTAKSVIISACIWPVAGAFFGWLAWASSERKYKKFMQKVQRNKT